MAGPAILIAAWSGRMLAASARRAGFVPLVVDSFGDSDTRELAGAIEILPTAFARGFRLKELSAAFDKLTTRAGTAPLGLVLGAGFEESPRLVAALAGRYRLLGCDADAIARCKTPGLFSPLLAELGIPHPAISRTPPAHPDGWLRRRIGGSGGTHISPVSARHVADQHHFFQQHIAGQAVSLSGVVGRHGLALGFSEQWHSPRPRHPYRFGGAVGPVTLDADQEARMIDIAVALVPRLGLVGLVSFDFLLVDGEPWLIEVNPRPGATLDIFDDATGSMFAAHVAATSAPEDLRHFLDKPPPDGASAVCYLYADEGPLTIPAGAGGAWPEWTSDRPLPSVVIPRFAPVLTVHAAAATAFAARELVLNRCQGLARQLGEGRSGKETTS